MKTLLLALLTSAIAAAQGQGTVFKARVFDGITTPQASAPLPNIGQAVHIMSVFFFGAVANVTGIVVRTEGSFDNVNYFPISEDITEATYNGSSYAYAIVRSNAAYPYVRLRYVTADPSNRPMTANYTGSLQPIGIFRFTQNRWVADSPLAGPTIDGLCMNLAGVCYIEGRRMTPIVPAQWTPTEIDTQTTVTNGTNSIFLDVGLGASAKVNMLCRTLPTPSNYHIRVHYLRTDGSAAGDNPARVGVMLRNSSTGEFVWWHQFIFDSFRIARWSNPTSEVGLYVDNPSRMRRGGIYSVDITDDGTNRIWRWWDGISTYREFQGTAETQGRTDFTTPNQVCVGTQETNGNYRTQMRLIGYDISPTW